MSAPGLRRTGPAGVDQARPWHRDRLVACPATRRETRDRTNARPGPPVRCHTMWRPLTETDPLCHPGVLTRRKLRAQGHIAGRPHRAARCLQQPADRPLAISRPWARCGQVAIVDVDRHRFVNLDRQHNALAPSGIAGKPVTQDRLGRAGTAVAAVLVGGVDEIDADVDRGTEDGMAVRLAGVGAEVHRAQTQFADRERSPAEAAILYRHGAHSVVPVTSGAPESATQKRLRYCARGESCLCSVKPIPGTIGS